MGTRNILSENQGVSAIIVAVAMVVFLICAALAIDVGFGLVVKNQLYDVADAASLAGTRKLGQIYAGYPTYYGHTLTGTEITDIRNAVTQVGADNMAGGQSITINVGDIRIGRWNAATRALTVTNTEPNAVEVMARRDTSANGSMPTFFARVMGLNSLSVTSVADRQGGMWTGQEIPTAALSGISKVDPGKLDIPVAVSQLWFTTHTCAQPIQFYPTTGSCAGWNTFTQTPSNATTLRSILQGMLAGTYTTPGVQSGTTSLQFTGGNVANALNDLQNLYNAKKDASGVWHTFVAVYQESGSCSNPNGAVTIVGFASVAITQVLAPPAGQLVQGSVECRVRTDERGGGTDYGTLSAIPGLVK